MNRNVTHNNHGGGCCGISHLSGFGYADMDSTGTLGVKSNPFPGGAFHYTKTNGRCLEVVLTDKQVRDMPVVVRHLKDHGFELVNRFYNSNSSNYCNVLHLTRESEDREALMKNSPFHRAAPAIEAVDPEPFTAIPVAAPIIRTVDNQRLNGHDGRRVFVVTGNGAPCHHHFPIGAYVCRTGQRCHSEGIEHYTLTEPSIDLEHQTQFVASRHVRPYVPGESRNRG